MAVTLNANTSSGLVQTADTSGELVLQSNGTTRLTVNSSGVTATSIQGTIVQGTAVASTSGTSIDFTGIPSWVKRVTVLFNAVSLSGTDNLLVQLGDSGGIETTGYVAQASTGTTIVDSTSGFIMRAAIAANSQHGIMTICIVSGNTWVSSSNLQRSSGGEVSVGAGGKTLSDVLTQIRITTTGTNTFDAGSINIQYEG